MLWELRNESSFSRLRECSSRNSAFGLQLAQSVCPLCRKISPLPQFVQGAPIRVDWQLGLAAAPNVALQPAVVGDVVHAAGGDGTVVRIEGGKTVWRVDTGRKLSAGVGANQDLVTVVTAAGDVIALDAGTGSVRWKEPVSAEVLARRGSTAASWWSVPPTTGSSAWLPTTASVAGSPACNAAAGAAQLCGRACPRRCGGRRFPGGKLVAVKLSNGGALWELSVATPRVRPNSSASRTWLEHPFSISARSVLPPIRGGSHASMRRTATSCGPRHFQLGRHRP